MFAIGQNQPFKSTALSPSPLSKIEKVDITMLAKKDEQDLEVSDGMVSIILRGSVHALSCSA